MSKQSNRGCLQLMRDQAWGFVFGLVGMILALTSIILTLPQAAPIRTGISQTLAGTTPTSEIPTVPPATPSPTPTPQVIPINQTMTCTECSGANNYSLIVRNATIDSANRQVTMLIGVQNNSTSTTYLGFNFLMLQDLQTGITTKGEGEGFSEFSITANQLILVRPTFQFVPVAGHMYSLSARMSNLSVSPITITF